MAKFPILDRQADVIATNLSDDKVLSLAERLLDWHKDRNPKKRLGRIIDDLGLAPFKAELGLPAE